MARPGSKWWVVVLGILVACQFVVLTFYFEDQRYLAHLLDRIAPATLPPSEQTMRVVAFLRDKPVFSNESYFLVPFFGFLRPTPRQVAKGGGDCADRSRLLIVLMRLRGIDASKWALYSRVLWPKHAVVEVEAEKGKMVVDPLFGLWFPRPEPGFYYGIQDLKEDPRILPARIASLRGQNLQFGANRVETYPLNEYIYDNARTINWNKSTGMRLLYWFLYRLMGEKADRIPRPFLAEQPALMVAVGIVPLQGCVLIVWLWMVKRRRTGLSNRRGY